MCERDTKGVEWTGLRTLHTDGVDGGRRRRGGRRWNQGLTESGERQGWGHIARVDRCVNLKLETRRLVVVGGRARRPGASPQLLVATWRVVNGSTWGLGAVLRLVRCEAGASLFERCEQ